MDLAGASATILPQACVADQALATADDLISAFAGRLLAYGDELSMLVSDVVKVTNQTDVDLSAATP